MMPGSSTDQPVPEELAQGSLEISRDIEIIFNGLGGKLGRKTFFAGTPTEQVFEKAREVMPEGPTTETVLLFGTQFLSPASLTDAINAHTEDSMSLTLLLDRPYETLAELLSKPICKKGSLKTFLWKTPKGSVFIDLAFMYHDTGRRSPRKAITCENIKEIFRNFQTITFAYKSDKHNVMMILTPQHPRDIFRLLDSFVDISNHEKSEAPKAELDDEKIVKAMHEWIKANAKDIKPKRITTEENVQIFTTYVAVGDNFEINFELLHDKFVSLTYKCQEPCISWILAGARTMKEFLELQSFLPKRSIMA